MLRKKAGKDGIKIGQAPASGGSASQRLLGPPRVDLNRLGFNKQQLNKQKIAEMVTNKIRDMKKENEIINKLSAQMQGNQRRKLKEFSGHFKQALWLQKPLDRVREEFKQFRQRLVQFSADNFKPTDYV